MSRTVIEDIGTEVDVNEFRPVHDYVLMKLFDRERTAGGVMLIESSQCTECALGAIVRVGSGVENPRSLIDFPMDLKVGDIALTMQYMGEKAKFRSGNYRLVRSHGVWATLTMKNLETHDIAEIHPRMSCVVVEPKSEEKTKSGIYLPNEKDARAANRWATVIKVGPGTLNVKTRARMPLEVKTGDEVVMMRYAGAEVTVNGKVLRIIDESDIRGVLEK